MPEGTSMIPIYHYGQLHLLDFSMAHYDNGSSVVPPSPYELNHVTTPTAMFVGAGDTTADPTDNEHLSNDLPNVFHYEACYIWNWYIFKWSKLNVILKKLLSMIVKIIYLFTCTGYRGKMWRSNIVSAMDSWWLCMWNRCTYICLWQNIAIYQWIRKW